MSPYTEPLTSVMTNAGIAYYMGADHTRVIRNAKNLARLGSAHRRELELILEKANDRRYLESAFGWLLL